MQQDNGISVALCQEIMVEYTIYLRLAVVDCSD